MGTIAALAGGVGAARFLRGLVRAMPAEDVVVVGNTGDDDVFHGLHVSPDLDTVTYTLAGAVGAAGLGSGRRHLPDPRGLRALRRGDVVPPRRRRPGHPPVPHQPPPRGRHPDGGDGRDHAGLGREVQAAADVRRPGGHRHRRRRARRWPHRCPWPCRSGSSGSGPGPRWPASASRGRPTPGPGPAVLDALAEADAILLCPSNPVISIGPILALPGDPRRPRGPGGTRWWG